MPYRAKPALGLIIVLAFAFQGCEKQATPPDNDLGGGKKTLAFPACNLKRTASSCPVSNICKGPSCAIDVSADKTGGVTVKLNNTTLTDNKAVVCVDQGATITWSTDNNFNFLGDFGQDTPFVSATAFSALTYFTGDGGSTANSTPHPYKGTTTQADKCYDYNLKVCPYPQNPSYTPVQCGERDPIVIVGNGGG